MASDSASGNGELLTEDLGAGAERAGCGLEIVGDEEAPPQPPQPEPAQDSLSTSARDATDQANEGRVEIIDDEESPPIQQYHTGREQREKAKMKAFIKGSVEQIPASEPQTDEIAARAHDDSATKVKCDLESVPSIPPLPDAFAALAYDDSLDLAMAKERYHTKESIDSVHEPGVEDESDAQPHIRDRSIIVQRNALDNRNRYDARAVEPDPRSQTIEVDTSPAPVRSNVITADTQVVSPYINENDEICIPEATRVDDSNIPAATVVRLDKYSLTIAGRNIRRRYLILGMLVILGVAIASVVTLTRDKEVAEAVVPSGAPSVSTVPTSYPSFQPSSGPTTALRAELASDISEFSNGKISSFSSDNHRNALDWLVKDQSIWREEPEKMPLSGPEIVERFVLALMYFETQGEGWSDEFGFMSKEHVCRWRGYLFQTLQKGIIRCTDGSVGRRVTSLALPDNKLKGSLPTELGLLHELNALRIGRNDIGGSIPDTLGLLINITDLELNDNDLVGPIDPLAGLPNLQYIDLTSNDLTGPLMDATNLTKLHTLKAGGNKFSGRVPESFSAISSLDIFHLHSNDLSGDINFMCKDMPSDYQLDCYTDNPEVTCNCCITCTKVSDESCDSDNEKMIILDVYAGKESDGFEWELRDGWGKSGVLIAAGGGYDDKEQLNVQLCLSIPGWYEIYTSQPLPPTLLPTNRPITPHDTHPPTMSSAPVDTTYSPTMGSNTRKTNSPTMSNKPSIITPMPTFSPTLSLLPTMKPTGPPSLMPTITSSPTNDGAKVSFSIDGYSSIVGPSSHYPGYDSFEVAANPTSNPTESPTASSFPTTSTLPTLRPTMSVPPTSTSRPSAPTFAPSFGATPTVGTNKTLSPTSYVGRPTYSPTPCDITFELSLKTDAFGIDTSWDLVDKSNGAIIASKGGFESNKTLSFEECLHPEMCYDFVIKDAWDDGICCQQGRGSYNVSVDGRLIGSGGEFGSSETVFIGGKCGGGGLEPDPSTSWSPPSSDAVGSDGSTPSPVTSYPTRDPTEFFRPPSNYSPTMTTPPTQSSAPTPVTPFPTETFLCPDVIFIGCTDPNPSNPINECPTVGAPCSNGNPGEFCCRDACPRNFCTAKQGTHYSSHVARDTTPVPIPAWPTYPPTEPSPPRPTYLSTMTTPPTHSSAPTPVTPFPTETFLCPDTNFFGCTAADPSNPVDECPTVGAPCSNGNPGEFCCRDACPRNFCTDKQGKLVARDDTAYMNVSEYLAFVSVLENDTPAAGGGMLSVRSILSDAANGECSISVYLTEVVYLPKDGFTGTDSCVYEACGITSLCDTATLTINVNG